MASEKIGQVTDKQIALWKKEHKEVYAGLGGIVGLALILISIKKLK